MTTNEKFDLAVQRGIELENENQKLRMEVERLQDCDSLCGPDQDCCYAGDLRTELAKVRGLLEETKRYLPNPLHGRVTEELK